MSKRDRAFDIPPHLQRPRASTSGVMNKATNVVAKRESASAPKQSSPVDVDVCSLQLPRGVARVALLAVIDARSAALQERKVAEDKGDFDKVVRAAEKELHLKLAMDELTRVLHTTAS